MVWNIHLAQSGTAYDFYPRRTIVLAILIDFGHFKLPGILLFGWDGIDLNGELQTLVSLK